MNDYILFILGGIGITLGVTLIALPMGFVVGLLLALVRIYGPGWAKWIVGIYSTVMRGIPPIVLLFLLYFLMSGAINLSPFMAGSLALGIISSAYQLEILRGAFLSVSGGQLMAARAVGMTRIQAIQHIMLPQALRLAIPPWSNEVANLIKDSSLVYALGVPEILRRSQNVSAATNQFFLAFGIAALVYFLLVFSSNRLLDWIEQKTRIPAF
jgi:polar amino acid transport system permease protein